MKAPYKIFVNFPGNYLHTVASDKTVNDIEYIRKDALLEWLNKAEIAANNDGIRAGFQIVIKKVELL